jgi:DNA polymerase/3'-5' exonuclease PolX
VEQLFSKIQNACQSVSADCEAEIMGSYRRGASQSSDIDVLIYPKNAQNLLEAFLRHVVQRLGDFITGALSSTLTDDYDGGKLACFQGICALDSKSKKRRIDIWTCQKDDVGAAKLHLTGNAEYNKVLRMKAHAKGFSLSQHGISLLFQVNKEQACEISSRRSAFPRDLAKRISVISLTSRTLLLKCEIAINFGFFLLMFLKHAC